MDKISTISYVVLILSGILFLLIKIDRRKILSDKMLLISKSTTFVLLCLSELYYFKYEENGMWFCDYKEVGWKVIIGFIILCVLLRNQFSSLMNILFHLHKSNRPADFRVGFYAYPVCIVGVLIGHLFPISFDRVLFYALLAAQLVQIVLIFYQNAPHWTHSVFSTIIYLLGTITFIIALVYFVIPFMAAAIIFFALYILSIVYPSNTININIRIKSD